MSLAAPAANGTIAWIVRSGHAGVGSACASPACGSATSRTPATAAWQRRKDVISISVLAALGTQRAVTNVSIGGLPRDRQPAAAATESPDRTRQSPRRASCRTLAGHILSLGGRGLRSRARQRGRALPLQEVDQLLADLAAQIESVARAPGAREHPQLDRALLGVGDLQLDHLAVL